MMLNDSLNYHDIHEFVDLIVLIYLVLSNNDFIVHDMNCSDIPPVALIAVHTELNGIQEGGYHCSAGTSYWSPKLYPSRW